MLQEVFLQLLTLSLILNIGLAIISFALVLVTTIIISKNHTSAANRDMVFNQPFGNHIFVVSYFLLILYHNLLKSK